MTGAADAMGNVVQLFTLVPSRNRTFLPGMNLGGRDITPLSQSVPGEQYQPLIPLNTMEDNYRNRRQSGQPPPHMIIDNHNMA